MSQPQPEEIIRAVDLRRAGRVSIEIKRGGSDSWSVHRVVSDAPLSLAEKRGIYDGIFYWNNYIEWHVEP